MEKEIEEKLEEYFLQAPPLIQEILLGDDLDTTVEILGSLYKLPETSFVLLKNLITLILLDITKPEDVVDYIEKNISLSKEDSLSLAKDLDNSILKNTNIKIFKNDLPLSSIEESSVDNTPKIKTLTVGNENPSNVALREEIISNTKEGVITPKTPTSTIPNPSVTKKISLSSPINGSYSQLLEQLEILDNIPKEEDVMDRLSKIQAQVEKINKIKTEEKQKGDLDPVEINIVPKKVEFPKDYSVDPYRENAV